MKKVTDFDNETLKRAVEVIRKQPAVQLHGYGGPNRETITIGGMRRHRRRVAAIARRLEKVDKRAATKAKR